jgi:hypothetical protein
MYLFDPRLGTRRRSLVRDRAMHAGRQFADFLRAAGRDLAHRGQGFLAESSHLLSAGRAPEQVLVARVRSKLGRYVACPHAIEVTVADGRVVLAGRVRKEEVPDLLRAVGAVRGVCHVENLLDVQAETAGDVEGNAPAPARGEPVEWGQITWSPATRLMAGFAGGALIARGCTQRFPIACLLGTIGAGLLTRAVTNRPVLPGAEASRRPRRRARSADQTAEVSRKLQQTWPF